MNTPSAYSPSTVVSSIFETKERSEDAHVFLRYWFSFSGCDFNAFPQIRRSPSVKLICLRFLWKWIVIFPRIQYEDYLNFLQKKQAGSPKQNILENFFLSAVLSVLNPLLASVDRCYPSQLLWNVQRTVWSHFFIGNNGSHSVLIPLVTFKCWKGCWKHQLFPFHFSHQLSQMEYFQGLLYWFLAGVMKVPSGFLGESNLVDSSLFRTRYRREAYLSPSCFSQYSLKAPRFEHLTSHLFSCFKFWKCSQSSFFYFYRYNSEIIWLVSWGFAIRDFFGIFLA